MVALLALGSFTANARTVSTLVVGGVWLLIALLGVLAQVPNYRGAATSYRFWASQPSAPANVLLLARMSRRHNGGRLIAVVVNAMTGISVVLGPFLYVVPPMPPNPIAAGLTVVLEVGLFTSECVLTYVSVREWLDRRTISRRPIAPTGQDR